MSTDLSSPWLTVAEAAAYAKVGEHIVSRWINEGQLRPAVTRRKKDLRGRGANGYLIERSDIDDLLRSLKTNVPEAVGGEPEPPPRTPSRRSPAPSGKQAFRDRIRRGGHA